MMPHSLLAIPLDHIFLEGCDFQIELSHQQEQLKITLDGGYVGDEHIIYFSLYFKNIASFYYENDEMWLEQLAKKYDLTTISEHAYRGIFRCDHADLEKIQDFDPLGRLNLTRFLVLGQHCYCEFIAQKEFSIQAITPQD